MHPHECARKGQALPLSARKTQLDFLLVLDACSLVVLVPAHDRLEGVWEGGDEIQRTARLSSLGDRFLVGHDCHVADTDVLSHGHGVVLSLHELGVFGERYRSFGS